jgi:hypothetical protein
MQQSPAVLKGRMKRYARAVMRRAVTRVMRMGGRRRVRVTADRGCADVALYTLLTAWGVVCVIRVKKRTKIAPPRHRPANREAQRAGPR